MLDQSKSSPARPTSPDEPVKPPSRDRDPVRQNDDPIISGDEKPAGYSNTDEPRDGVRPSVDPVEPQGGAAESDLLH